ncbi:Rieske (2Fe-2S) protein [Cecembia sp.]|uniref:QcrA and Rieske domain-containing protein n=1 Tax=Cecembia sp. TaxID=1898110 RepID=UPI0025C1C1D4|nr:Rieske (2Fe-2S) protein [Cecembia sp.]
MKNLENVQTGRLSTERREFLKKSGAMALMSAFGVSFFTSCSSDDDTPNRPNDPPAPSTGISVQGSEITVNLAEATALASSGGWALVSAARVLIVNVGENNFNALTSVCTHARCDNSWQFANNVFTCTCHGSRFSTDGTVINGPALQPLRSFPTELDGNTLKVNFG